MAALPYTKRSFIERLKKHIANDFPGDDFSITNNEMLLYIDAAIPFVMKGQMFENAKVTGFLDVPEAYLVTYNHTISNQNSNTNEWYVTLAQTPLSLPTGYDITSVYMSGPSTGRGQNAMPVSAKRKAYRNYLPKPSGFFYRLETNIMYLEASDGGSLLNYNLSVQMPISRTADLDAVMSMPDDAIELVFERVVNKLLQRYQIPQDTVQDDLPPGNKTS